MMADIFNHLDRTAEARFVAGLEERNREAADRIKALMFTFNDLQRLTPAAIQVVLSQLDKSKLPLAIKGANGEGPWACSSPIFRSAPATC